MTASPAVSWPASRRAAVDRQSDDAPFRAAMIAGTITASYVPEDFSVAGLLRRTEADLARRESELRSMMIP